MGRYTTVCDRTGTTDPDPPFFGRSGLRKAPGADLLRIYCVYCHFPLDKSPYFTYINSVCWCGILFPGARAAAFFPDSSGIAPRAICSLAADMSAVCVKDTQKREIQGQSQENSDNRVRKEINARRAEIAQPQQFIPITYSGVQGGVRGVVGCGGAEGRDGFGGCGQVGAVRRMELSSGCQVRGPAREGVVAVSIYMWLRPSELKT